MLPKYKLTTLVAEFDFALLGAAMLLTAIGIFVLAQLSEALGVDYAERQTLWLGAGLAALGFACAVDYLTLARLARFLYALLVAVLAALLVWGRVTVGAKSWIDFGSFSLQPSEAAKIVAVLMAAVYLAEREDARAFSWKMFLALSAIFGVPALLTAMQPDLGSAVSFLPPYAVFLFLGGAGWRKLAFIGACAAALALVGWFALLKDYQKARLVTFAHPSADPQGKGYQTLQSKIAVGAGGIAGRGSATQSSLRFLPAQHTDFIFSAFAERHGFFGVAVAIAMYAFILFRLLGIAQTAKDSLGFFIAAGVFALTAFQTVLNLGMAIGFFPITGLPLPWFSYGGSSLLAFMTALGLALNVKMRRFVN